MYVLVPLTWLFIFKMPWVSGLKAIGDYPAAADSVVWSVRKVQIIAALPNCAVAGLGGCFLIISQVFEFTEHLSAGKGFIALATLKLCRWNPVGALLACQYFVFQIQCN